MKTDNETREVLDLFKQFGQEERGKFLRYMRIVDALQRTEALNAAFLSEIDAGTMGCQDDDESFVLCVCFDGARRSE